MRGCRSRWISAVLGAGVGLPGTACTTVATEVQIGILLPEDETPLAATDNVHMTLSPSGFSDSLAVDGPDFTFTIELDPDGVERTLTVYFADQERLLGYGATLPFQYGPAASLEIQTLIGYPGRLATFPHTFDLPDASSIAASFAGQHVLVLASDGSTLFMDGHTYAFEGAASWPADRPVPASDDGVMVSEGTAIVSRLWWTPDLAALTFDLRENAWVSRAIVGDAGTDRAGAAFSHDPETRTAWLFGGGQRTDVASLDLSQPNHISLHPAPQWQLDAPRQGAQALRLPTPTSPEWVIIGGDDPTVARVYFVERGLALGPIEAWTGLQCVVFDREIRDVARILCAGGLRSDVPTDDALLVALPTAGTPEVTILEHLLSAPQPDVQWFHDDFALYAQGDSSFDRVARNDFSVTSQPSVTGRTTRGSRVELATGLHLLVGGALGDGSPANRWQVFAPSLSPNAP